jgi:glycosyltransferase involved in cell wall biosynthesis
VPARNEEENVNTILDCLSNQSLSNSFYEIIFVDDHSTDQTHVLAETARISNLKVLSLKNSNSEYSAKKAAIAYGISKARGDIIVTVDADCRYQTTWLITMLSYFEKNKLQSLSGPVLIQDNNSLLDSFQALDVKGSVAFMAAGILHKSHFMAFGANFMYSKEKFEKYMSSGWKPEIATGDDMFLVESIAIENDQQVGFIKNKNSIALTSAEPGLKALLRQRMRWASKSKSYRHSGLKKVLTISFLFNLLVWINMFLAIFFGTWFFWNSVLLIFLKIATDYLILSRVGYYFNEPISRKYFIQNVILHSLYIVFIGMYGIFFKKYAWKGRVHS